jgi:AcrR family transcriptional regulator
MRIHLQREIGAEGCADEGTQRGDTVARMTEDRKAATRQLLTRPERQAQLLAAAAAAFARAGFASTSMDDVANEAGVTKLILYRHFESKDELYRSVLTAVADRLGEEYNRTIREPQPQRNGFATRSMLVVARENPDGFRLLTVHAAREPQFAPFVTTFRDQSFGVADALIGDMIPDAVTRAWAARVMVEYLVVAVLEWLDVGDPVRDDEFVMLSTQGLRGMFLGFADEEKLNPTLRSAFSHLRREALNPGALTSDP